MGKRNVVLFDGTVVTATDEQLAALTTSQGQTARVQSADEQVQGLVTEYNDENTSAVRAALEGAADSATFGIYGAANELITGGHKMRATAEANPGARLVGEIAGVFTPGGAGNLAARAGERVAARVAGRAGVATVAQAARGAKAGLVTEGALLGIGGAVSQSNVSGDPLTIAGVVEAAGIGGLLNLGVGTLVGKLTGSAAEVSTPVAKAGATADEIAAAKMGQKIWKDPPPSWTEFANIHKEAGKATEAFNRKIAKEAEDYAAATAPDALNSTVNTIEKTRNSLLAKVNKSEFAKTTNAVTKEYAKTLSKREKKLLSSEWAPKWFNGSDLAVKRIPRRFGPAPDDAFAMAVARAADAAEAVGKKGDKATIASVFEKMDPLLRGESLDDFTKLVMKAGAEDRIPLAKAFGSKTDDLIVRNFGKPPITPGVKEEVKGLRAMLSDAGKLRGGYKPNGTGTWTPEGAQQLEAMLDKMHEFRDAMWKYSRIPIGDLPPRASSIGLKLPTAGADIVAAREQAAVIDSAVQSARKAIGENRVDDAIAEIRALRSKLPPEVEVPLIPKPPGDLKKVDVVELPANPKQFARMTHERVAKLAEEMGEAVARGENGSAQAFDRWLADIGFERSGDVVKDVVAAHNRLSGARAAYDKLEELGKAVAEKESKSIVGWLRRAAKGGAAGAVGFGLFGSVGGGIAGAAAASAGRSAVRSGMDAAEEAFLVGTMTSNKASIRDRIRSLVGSKSASSTSKMSKLGPISATLAGGLMTGQVDKEKDMRKLTVNRINDVTAAAQSAPDTMFAALQPLMGQPGDVAFKIHSMVVGAMQHLAQYAPKDPGTDTTMFESRWLPSWAESMEFAARYEAVMDPMRAMARFFAGDGHPAAADTLWTVWNPLMNEAATEMSVDPGFLRNATYAQQSGYEDLFGMQTGLSNQTVGLALQGLYLPRPEQAAMTSTPTPGGRPPAVKSSVAGSSVSGLISQ